MDGPLPDIYQFEIGRVRESVIHTDEEGGQNEQGCQVDCHRGLEIHALTVVETLLCSSIFNSSLSVST